MIRRTLAIAGAVVLTAGLTGLAGPAGADPGTGITLNGTTLINEVGAELDEAGPSGFVNGGFVEIKNIDSASMSLQGWELEACTSSSTFDRVTIGNVVLGPNDTYVIGDDAFLDPLNGGPNQRFDTGEVLEQIAGGVALFDPAFDPTLENAVDEVAWGSNPVACADPDAGHIPNDDESLNRDLTDTPDFETWLLASATPEPL